jgi:hypothetical protein
MVMGALLVVVTALLLALTTARWCAARAIDGVDLPTDDVSEDRRQLLPQGHQPPPGLSPLSPSERFLAAETSRGLRDLETFLSDAA